MKNRMICTRCIRILFVALLIGYVRFATCREAFEDDAPDRKSKSKWKTVTSNIVRSIEDVLVGGRRFDNIIAESSVPQEGNARGRSDEEMNRKSPTYFFSPGDDEEENLNNNSKYNSNGDQSTVSDEMDGVYTHKDVVLYRLIGNDMPPLERNGQLLRNTMYALENEAKDIPRIERRWILNRIIDPNLHASVRREIVRHGYNRPEQIIDIPFESEHMCAKRSSQDRVHYTTNQNAARNQAYRRGMQDGFRWILIFDGNGFLSNGQSEALLRAIDIAERRRQRAIVVPMIRLNVPQAETFLNESTTVEEIMSAVPFFSEPQIGFRNDLLDPAELPYDEDLKYGVMNKLDLLDRCGYLSTSNLHRSEHAKEKRRRRSRSWTHETCHCGSFRLSYRSAREPLTPNTLDIDSDALESTIRRAYQKNIRSARRCGLWLRLYPWPEERAVDFLSEKGMSASRVSDHEKRGAVDRCRSIGLKSTAEIIRCRASVREQSKIEFRRLIDGTCDVSIRQDRKRRHHQAGYP
eukprot:g2749.t1